MNNRTSFQLLIRKIALISYDVMAVFLASALGLLARFDFRINNIDGLYLNSVKEYFLVNVLVTILIFIVMRLYNSLWQYASVSELENIIVACMLSAVTQIIGMSLMECRVPISYHFVYYICLTVLVLGSRFVYRFLRNLINGRQKQKTAVHRVMVIGAGDADHEFLQERLLQVIFTLQRKVLRARREE